MSAGPAKTADVLRTALAMGADDAVHVEIPDNSLGGPLEPLGVSKILQAVIAKENEKEEVGLVIMGKQAIDDDASQTGQMLAAMLNWPQATFASKLEFLGKLEKGEKVRVTREIDGGLGVVETKLPFVMTTDLRLNGGCLTGSGGFACTIACRCMYNDALTGPGTLFTLTSQSRDMHRCRTS